MLKIAAAVIGSMGLWILFVSGIKPEEMIVGVVSTVLTIAFSWYLIRRCSLSVRLRWIDFVQIWYLPWYLIEGSWEILSVFFLDVLHIHPAGSFFRATQFEAEPGGRIAAGRRALAITYTTATPNFIILGISRQTRWMLFHQLKKSGILSMTKKLGAQG